jgi:hypothetical protein
MRKKFVSAEATQELQEEGSAKLKRKLMYLFMAQLTVRSVTRPTKHGNTLNVSLVMFGIV